MNSSNRMAAHKRPRRRGGGGASHKRRKSWRGGRTVLMDKHDPAATRKAGMAAWFQQMIGAGFRGNRRGE